MQNSTRLDIIDLINNSPITSLSKDYQTRLLTKIEEFFTNDQQQLFIASFYCYLNHDTKNDFVISLNIVWKWCGFTRQDNAKRVIEKNFVLDIDYKLILLQVEGNLKGGRPKEEVLMTVHTFKKFCLKACTKKADEIHEYYIKLEELLQETMNEEIKLQIEEKDKEIKLQIEEKDKEIKLQIEEKDKIIVKLQNKPDTEGFIIINGYIYLIKDICAFGCYKIGLGDDPNIRLYTLNTASSQKSLEIVCVFKTSNMKNAEKIIHLILEPFRIKKRREWFYLPDDLALVYSINVIKDTISNIDQYNFDNHDEWSNFAIQYPDNLDELKKEFTKVKP